MSTLRFAAIALTDLAVPGTDPWSAQAGDPALSVMTDFRERSSVTIGEADSVAAALEHMKHAGVRCAFATSHAGRVVGLVTAYDLLGEKPTLHARASGVVASDVHVRDVMTRTADWQVLDVRHVELATVAQVQSLMQGAHLTHLAVLEGADPGWRLRGIFSAAKIRRLLGS